VAEGSTSRKKLLFGKVGFSRMMLVAAALLVAIASLLIWMISYTSRARSRETEAKLQAEVWEQRYDSADEQYQLSERQRIEDKKTLDALRAEADRKSSPVDDQASPAETSGNTSVFFLSSTRGATRENGNQVRVPRGIKIVVLSVQIETDEAFERFRAEITNANRVSVWRNDGRAQSTNNTVSIMVQSKVLQSGYYELTL